MLKKLMISAAAGLAAMFAVASANAATLSIVGGTPTPLPAEFADVGTGLNVGDLVTVFTSANGPGEGLALSGPATLKFEFIGHEAAFVNRAIETIGGVELVNNINFVPGQFTTVYLTPDVNGLVPFKFTTDAGTGVDPTKEAINGNIDDTLSMAFSAIAADGSVIALFGDGAGDVDYEDLAIRISVVPLPPAMALFGGALLGLGWLSRRRKQA